ncbi:hypothetical protein Trydic_g5335 [Trypoxylus dichotomus]
MWQDESEGFPNRPFYDVGMPRWLNSNHFLTRSVPLIYDVEFEKYGALSHSCTCLSINDEIWQLIENENLTIQTDQTKAWPHKHNWEVIIYPPQYPDMAPSDFHLIGLLIAHLSGERFEDDDES